MWPFKKHKKSESDILIDKIKNEKLDMPNLFANINGRVEIEMLYKELCSLTHTDMYVNDDKKAAIAGELFRKVQANRADLNKLKELKEEIKQQLNLN